MGKPCLNRQIIDQLLSNTSIDLERYVVVHDDKIYGEILRNPSLGLGESYMAGLWDVQNIKLDEFFQLIAASKLHQRLTNNWYHRLLGLGTWLYHRYIQGNNSQISKIVAEEHYDLTPELFRHMLGSNMIYSCAYYEKPEMDLEQAQIAKMERIARKLKLVPGQHVLDIGCGWGGLAHYLAAHYQVYVTAITNSVSQYEYAQIHNYHDDVQYILTDYRDYRASIRYDRIVSVGMFEHVGTDQYGIFMQMVDDHLKESGLCLLHTISQNVSKYVGDPWLSKYIFPNSILPSLQQITRACEGHFVIEDVDNFGIHYARTLNDWYKRLVTVKDQLPRAKFRMWEYYLLYCAGYFQAREVQLYQVVMSKYYPSGYTRDI